MLKELYVDNFKSLNGFQVKFNPSTFIIGKNASGKSTVLNAIIFLKYCCTDSVNAYLDKHQVTVNDLCSKSSKKRTISFQAIFEFGEVKIFWNIEFTASKADNTLILSSERITEGNKTLLSYSSTDKAMRGAFGGPYNVLKPMKSYRLNEQSMEQEEIIRGEYKSSHLSIIGKESTSAYPSLSLIKGFFDATEPFDLLSPKDMRGSARGNTDSIGRYGEKLAAFVKGLSSQERQELIRTLQTVFPNIVDVKSVIRGQPGWAYLEVEESYAEQNISVSSRNVSDGMIRLIAFFAMKYHKNHGGVTLLDEIENGINSEVMERLLKAFQENSIQNKQQFIATTHNTVLLDYVEPDNIRYLFRDASGNTVAVNPFTSPELREKLGYMYPGEIILNTPNSKLETLSGVSESEGL